MRHLWKLALIAVLLAGGLAIVQRESLLRLHAVNTLFAEDRIVANFSHMDRLFHHTRMDVAADPASPVPRDADMDLPAGFADWLTARAVTSVVVLKNGALVHESYHLGTGPGDLRISWSVAKSFISALIGVLLDQGVIRDIDDPVTDYAPALKGSAYDGVSLRNVLQMSSGVTFDEDYLDFWSDINKMGRVLALGGSMDAFAAGQDRRFQAPGVGFRYVSIDTHVLGMVARGATGRSVADLMTDHILRPMAPEADAYYVTDSHGAAFVLGGLNLTTRDYARMGQMFLQDGMLDGRQIVPRAWVRASTVPSARTRAGEVQYGYQWWMPKDAEDGEFFARGIYGQYIYVDRARGVVIATTAADRAFREPGVNDANIAMFRALAKATEGR